MRRLWMITSAAWLASAPLLAPAFAAPPRLVVLELFTSEGCSSCPPADALLSELARTRADVLALAFHVTYWDRLGWPDPFALEAATQRQRRYAGSIGLDSIYTPQMVVDGVRDVVGSDREGMLAAVAAQQAAARPALSVILTRAGDAVTVRVGAGAPVDATVLLVGYDSSHVTAVQHGENAGRTLSEANVVRGLVSAGAWRGAAVTLRAPPPPGEHLAALVQAADGGILGAARVD